MFQRIKEFFTDGKHPILKGCCILLTALVIIFIVIAFVSMSGCSSLDGDGALTQYGASNSVTAYLKEVC